MGGGAERRRRRARAWLAAALCVCAPACSGGDGADGDGRDGPRSAAGMFDAPAPEAAEAPLERPVIPEGSPTVAFLSDSIGAGLHLAEDQAFPAVLQRRLAQGGVPFRLVNASESGRTSAGGVTALDWILRSRPDVLVIGLGGNDGLRGVPLEEIERNLRRLLERAQEEHLRVLLLGIRIPPNYGDYAARFDALYPALADEYGVDFVPFYMEGVGGKWEENLGDGLHPTPEGHELLAENIAPALKKLLTELSAEPEPAH